ncbi:MAG TPA: VOC family protein [Thermoanaerobaculia bacterium]|nr:VOC family protein [Thermoanaerobaculia bacterium]
MKSDATHPNIQQAVPFFWVRDIEASVRFYVDLLGFAKTRQWAPDGKLQWCLLERGAVALMLQEFSKDTRHRNPSSGKAGVGVQICFICADAIAFWRELTERGVSASCPFVGNGMWVTEVSDPDGYSLLFESPTDAPEESVLGEES